MITRFYNGIQCEFWGDKYPEYIFYLNDIKRIFPDARFICLVRHPYYVARSLYTSRAKECRQFNFNEPRRDLKDCVQQWYVWNRFLREYLQSDPKDHLLLLRYEDLIGDPFDSLQQIAQFLNSDLLSDEQVVSGFLGYTNTVRDKSDPYYEGITSHYSEELIQMANEFGYDPHDPFFRAPSEKEKEEMIEKARAGLSGKVAISPGGGA